MLFFPDYRGSKMPTRDFFFTVSIPVAQRNSNPGNSAYLKNSVPGEIPQIRVFEMIVDQMKYPRSKELNSPRSTPF